MVNSNKNRNIIRMVIIGIVLLGGGLIVVANFHNISLRLAKHHMQGNVTVLSKVS